MRLFRLPLAHRIVMLESKPNWIEKSVASDASLLLGALDRQFANTEDARPRCSTAISHDGRVIDIRRRISAR